MRFFLECGAIRPFVQMLYGLAETAEMMPLLMGYEGLKELMVGCIFWGANHTDILERCEPHKGTMGPHTFPFMADFAGGFLERVMKSYEREGENKFYFQGEGNALVQQIGTTLCGRDGVIFVSGLIQLLRCNKTNEMLLDSNFLDKGTTQRMLTLLVYFRLR